MGARKVEIQRMQHGKDSEAGAQGRVVLVARGNAAEGLPRLAQQAGLGLQVAGSAREISLERLPAAVLLPLDVSPEDWASVRENPAFAGIPLLGVARGASELAFAETFARGGEDLLLTEEPEDTVTKLRAIPIPAQKAEPSTRRVLIVSPSAAWRASMARRLHGAGIEAGFAGPEDAVSAASAGPPELFLLDTSGGLEEAAALVSALRGVSKAPCLASVAPGEVRRGAALLEGLEGVAVHDAFGLADALLFLTNETLSGSVQERRRSRRLLFGTCVWARPAGAEQDRIGYSYTISEGGLFLRSMAPFAVGTRLWVELSPPRAGRRVRLAATSVWNRGFGPLDRAISPPGTGLRIDGGLPGEWELFQDGCRTLLDGAVPG